MSIDHKLILIKGQSLFADRGRVRGGGGGLSVLEMETFVFVLNFTELK